ncbi:MAG: hypothetical protein WBW82_02125, partial [Candidatus Sulfotelmatobacter sp.]
AGGTLTLLNSALLSAHYGPLRHPKRPGPALASFQLIPTANHRWGFPCCIWSPGIHAVATTPAGLMGLIRSCFPINVGLPRRKGGSAPALPVAE